MRLDLNISKTNAGYLFVLPWKLSYLGGVNQVVTNLAREMQRSGAFNPIILIADWDAVDPIAEETSGLKTVRWRLRSFHNAMTIKEKIAFWIWEKKFRVQFQIFCERNQIVAINPHFPGPIAATIDRIIKNSKMAIPLIFSFHGSDLKQIEDESRTDISHWKNLLENAHGVVACSNDLSEKIVSFFGKAVSPRVIHNGLDVAAFGAMAKEPSNIGKRFILNVAKFERKKGQDILIEAFAKIAGDYPDIDLVLIGKPDEFLPVLRELCATTHIESRVCFFPNMPHDQVANFFRQAVMFVLPSRQEPFGIVVLEAGAFGLPVIATNVGGVPEILTDKVTGRLIPVDDVPELENCLRSILDEPVQSQVMGRNLHDHVINNFTWISACQKYQSILNSCSAKQIHK